MLLRNAHKLALELMKAHGLRDWTYDTNNRKRALGLCFSELKKIELSVHFIEHNKASVVRDTILHEIAHALVGTEHRHDEVWMAKAGEIGCVPRRLNRRAVMPPGPWQATCAGCGRFFSKFRKPKKVTGFNCRNCGPKLGRLSFKREPVTGSRSSRREKQSA